MKKICLFVLTVLAAVIAFSACTKRDTYADKLKSERKAISRFIIGHDIDLLDEYPEDGIFAENEYFKDNNTGVYFRVNYSGSGDTIKMNNRISLCNDTLNIFLAKNDTLLGNDVSYSGFYSYAMEFIYGKEKTYVASNSSSSYPDFYFQSAGCVIPLKYGLKDKGEVSILIPFSSGSSYQQSKYEPIFMERLTYYIID